MYLAEAAREIAHHAVELRIAPDMAHEGACAGAMESFLANLVSTQSTTWIPAYRNACGGSTRRAPP